MEESDNEFEGVEMEISPERRGHGTNENEDGNICRGNVEARQLQGDEHIGPKPKRGLRNGG